ILARQGQIPAAQLDDTWRRMVDLFVSINSSPQLFDAGRDSLRIILVASTAKSLITQDELIDLLAGPPQTIPDGLRMHREVASAMRSAMDGQRLVTLDTILALGEGLQQMAHGKASADDLVPMAGELREFEMPRPIFSSAERTEWAPGVYNNRH